MTPDNDLQRKLKAKILTNESKLKINADSSINFISSIIELDEKDLYFYSPSGNTLNFSYDAAFGLLNFQSKNFDFSQFMI